MSQALASRLPVPAAWLTPRPGRSAPIHRWFVFPHSYAPELVAWLFDRLDVQEGSTVLDPLCGAGTTLVEAQRRRFRPIGVDLLPLAVLASRAKTNPVRRNAVSAGSRAIARAVRAAAPSTPPPPLLDRAFSGHVFGRLDSALRAACGSGEAADSLTLAVLSTARRFSKLVADGGWLRLVEPELTSRDVPGALEDAMRMVEDEIELVAGEPACVELGDARSLPLADRSVDAAVTSPPYPNRHDYTRVFAVELELGFRLGDAMREVRYRALRSHPEARPPRNALEYPESRALSEQIEAVSARHPDPRVARMLRGYFQDMVGVLSEVRRVLKPHGRAAFVVGNAQYCGVPIPVDEHLAEIGERVGLVVDEVVTLRLRGNSAQQMAEYGRQASRESVVSFRRPPRGVAQR